MADDTQTRSAAAVGLVVALCFITSICEGFDVQAAGVAAAGISHDFKPSPGRLGWFFAAVNLGLIAGAVIGGPLADRVGRRPVLTASLAVFGACTILSGLSPSFEVLTATRLLVGLGLGGAIPNAIALVTDVSTAQARNGVIATTYIGMPVGGSLASLMILGLGAARWRELFFLGGVTPIVVAALRAVLLRGQRDAREHAPRSEQREVEALAVERHQRRRRRHALGEVREQRRHAAGLVDE